MGMSRIDLIRTREESKKRVKDLGYDAPVNLPLLDEPLTLRAEGEIVSRALALSAVVAASYGFSRENACEWLKRESLFAALSEREGVFISDGSAPEFQAQVETLYAFAWSLGFLPELDFGKACPRDLILVFPDLKMAENSDRFRRAAKRRSLTEIGAMCDLAYCLHWAIKEAKILGRPQPGSVRPHVIIERRRALDWMLSRHGWDDLSLDT